MGLPEPHSDDPTQWLFEGDVVSSEAPLHVAVVYIDEFVEGVGLLVGPSIADQAGHLSPCCSTDCRMGRRTGERRPVTHWPQSAIASSDRRRSCARVTVGGLPSGHPSFRKGG
jgi:hypothetical protein